MELKDLPVKKGSNITGGNVHTTNTPHNSSIWAPSRRQRGFKHKRHPYEVYYDPTKDELVVARGSLIMYRLCPEEADTILPTWTTPHGTNSYIDSKGDYHFDGQEISTGGVYEVALVSSTYASDQIGLHVRPEGSAEAEDRECFRTVILARFRLVAAGERRKLDFVDQMWKSDISWVWKSLGSDGCCDEEDSGDSGDDGSDGDDSGGSGGDESEDNDSGGDDGGSDSDDSGMDSEGICSCPVVNVSARFSSTEEGELCFTTGLVEQVFIVVDIFPPEFIECPDAQLGAQTEMFLRVRFTDAVQQWTGPFCQPGYYWRPLDINYVNPMQFSRCYVQIPAQMCQEKTLEWQVFRVKRHLGQTISRPCPPSEQKIKLPGIMIPGDICSDCSD